jgi:hypothetical protein
MMKKKLKLITVLKKKITDLIEISENIFLLIQLLYIKENFF